MVGGSIPYRIALLLIYKDRQVIVLHEWEYSVWKLTLMHLTEFFLLSLAFSGYPYIDFPLIRRLRPHKVL